MCPQTIYMPAYYYMCPHAICVRTCVLILLHMCVQELRGAQSLHVSYLIRALNKARDEYNAQLLKGKEMGLDEAAHWQAEPVQVRIGHTHDIEGTETVHEHRELK